MLGEKLMEDIILRQLLGDFSVGSGEPEASPSTNESKQNLEAVVKFITESRYINRQDTIISLLSQLLAADKIHLLDKQHYRVFQRTGVKRPAFVIITPMQVLFEKDFFDHLTLMGKFYFLLFNVSRLIVTIIAQRNSPTGMARIDKATEFMMNWDIFNIYLPKLKEIVDFELQMSGKSPIFKAVYMRTEPGDLFRRPEDVFPIAGLNTVPSFYGPEFAGRNRAEVNALAAQYFRSR